MAVQDIYLSPRKILSHLRDIEKKVPRQSFTLYRTSISPSGVVTQEQLEHETLLMLEFAGLKGYKADVKYVALEKGVGGNISLNDTSERCVHINVSDEYRSNWKATVAVLAHEICHKVLFVHGLYYAPPFTTMNEVFVDLATIYMGFGQLILDGYITTAANTTHYLGYLTFDTYKVTHLIVYSALGGIEGEQTGLQDADLFASTAVERWEEDADKSKVLNTYFMKRERQIAELHRNIMVMEQLLGQCKKDMAYHYDVLDQQYFKDPERSGNKIGSPLAAFSAIYEYEFYEEKPQLEKLNNAINRAIYDVFVTYQEQKSIELRYDFSCPFCGKTSKNTTIENRSAIVTCPGCGRHYTYNGEHWNVTKRQRELDIERRQREQRFNDEVSKREWEIRCKANAATEEIRMNEQRRCREAILKRIPAFWRWFVGKYITG